LLPTIWPPFEVNPQAASNPQPRNIQFRPAGNRIAIVRIESQGYSPAPDDE
jgi:hypothetical protein